MKFPEHPRGGPDYSSVDSREKAEALVGQGLLVALLMLPEAFGGEPLVENIVYVPEFVAELKARADQNIIAPLVAEGKITRYSVTPRHDGSCFVPVSLRIEATEPAAFFHTIKIWGVGLMA